MEFMHIVFIAVGFSVSIAGLMLLVGSGVHPTDLDDREHH